MKPYTIALKMFWMPIAESITAAPVVCNADTREALGVFAEHHRIKVVTVPMVLPWRYRSGPSRPI
jgi:hypothetical protein